MKPQRPGMRSPPVDPPDRDPGDAGAKAGKLLIQGKEIRLEPVGVKSYGG